MPVSVQITTIICITVIACWGILCFSPLSKNENENENKNEKEGK